VTGKKWKLVVNPLSGSTTLHQFEVEAANWMGALRSARKQLGEDGGLPNGASCAVTPDGVVTILDPNSRRRFVLSPIARGAEPLKAPAADPKLLPDADQRGVKPAKFRTIAYAPSHPVVPPTPAKPATVSAAAAPPPSAAKLMAARNARAASQSIPAPAPAGARPAGARPPSANVPQPSSEHSPPKPAVNAQVSARQVDATDQKSALAPTTSSDVLAASSTSGARTKMNLELMLSRDVEPGPENPLTYRERAYLMPKGMSVSEAEAALRFQLAEMQQQFATAPKGKFINLAAFDHNWIDRPSRPPLVSLEWRDWRGEPAVDYPAAAASVPPSPAEGDERLAAVFEALHELAHLRTAAEGLDFSIKLLSQVVPCEALSGCLYDINTDELRLVAVHGISSDSAQGKAISRSSALFGKAAQLEHAALVIPDLRVEQAYEPMRDGRLGMNATNMLLRPLTHEGRLLGMLQLINRTTGGFSTSDVHLVNYLAERLAEFLREARARIRS
jgi:hypothetical protein